LRLFRCCFFGHFFESNSFGGVFFGVDCFDSDLLFRMVVFFAGVDFVIFISDDSKSEEESEEESEIFLRVAFLSDSSPFRLVLCDTLDFDFFLLSSFSLL